MVLNWNFFSCLSFFPQKWATGHQISLRLLTTQRTLCGNYCKFKILKTKLCYSCLVIHIRGCLLHYFLDSAVCSEYSILTNNLVKILPNSLDQYIMLFICSSSWICMFIFILCGFSKDLKSLYLGKIFLALWKLNWLKRDLNDKEVVIFVSIINYNLVHWLLKYCLIQPVRINSWGKY